MDKLYRHGDLLIKRIESKPSNLKKTNDKVLAYGEVTGHKHQLMGGLVNVFEGSDGLKVIEILEPTQLVHEEHKAITIGKGLFTVTKERELDLLGEVKQVVD